MPSAQNATRFKTFYEGVVVTVRRVDSAPPTWNRPCRLLAACARRPCPSAGVAADCVATSAIKDSSTPHHLAAASESPFLDFLTLKLPWHPEPLLLFVLLALLALLLELLLVPHESETPAHLLSILRPSGLV